MPKQTLKMKIADLLAQKGEGESVAGDAGVAGDADIGAPPAEAPMPAPMPEAPEMEMPEAPEMETDVVGGMPGVLMAGAMEGDYDAPEMDMNEKRDAAVAKSMDSDNYTSWQPKGDPYRYELIAGDAPDMSGAYIVATKDGRSVKIRQNKDPETFYAALGMNPEFAEMLKPAPEAEMQEADPFAAGKQINSAAGKVISDTLPLSESGAAVKVRSETGKMSAAAENAAAALAKEYGVSLAELTETLSGLNSGAGPSAASARFESQ